MLGNELWTLGGTRNNSAQVSEVWRSSDGVSWQQVALECPEGLCWGARTAHGAATRDGTMWLLGGRARIAGILTEYTDIWSSADGVSWQRSERELAEPRAGFGLSTLGTAMYVTGGWNDSAGVDAPFDDTLVLE